MDSLKVADVCEALVEYAYSPWSNCKTCPALEFCECPIFDEDFPSEADYPTDEDCKRVALKWLSYELGIPFAFDCEDEDD